MLLTSGIVVLLLAQVWNSLGSAPTTGVDHAIGIEHAIGALAGVETRLFSASATLDEMSAHANAHDGSPSAHAQKEAERIERERQERAGHPRGPLPPGRRAEAPHQDQEGQGAEHARAARRLGVVTARGG